MSTIIELLEKMKTAVLGKDVRQTITDAILQCYFDMSENAEEYINRWLENHPEATTTVQDGAITEAKLSSSLSLKKATSHKTIADMAADTALQAGMFVTVSGYDSFGDDFSGTYLVREFGQNEIYDATALVKLDNGLCAELAGSRTVKTDAYSSNFTIDECVKNEIINCALSYYRNNNKLYYGNTYTANNVKKNPYDDTYSGETSDGTPHSTFTGRLQIDCSSFVELVLSGIPFEQSVYVEENMENTRFYDWGYQWNHKERYYDAGGYRMLANDIALYCRDKGWIFRRKEDCSNLQTGDILFFKGDAAKGFWGDIRHTAIFLYVDGYGYPVIFDVGNRYVSPNAGDYSTNAEYQQAVSNAVAAMHTADVRRVTVSYMAQCEYAARLPLTASRTCQPKNLFYNIPEFQKNYTGITTAFLATGRTKDAIGKGKFYTIVANITQDPAQKGQTIAVKATGAGITIFDRHIYPANTEPDGTYIFRCFFGDDTDKLLENTFSFDFIAYNTDENGAYILTGAEQINTTVNWLECFEGIWNPSRTEYIDYILPAIKAESLEKGGTIYVNLAGSGWRDQLDTLHASALDNTVYTVTVRAIELQDAAVALSGHVWMMQGWRYMAGYGKQIFTGYWTNKQYSRNLVNNVWSDIEEINV